ncbi:MAG: glycosyltransferase [Planctomycetota bacterium]|nr:glycosyltransferase [Planctomycetota bacterium]
MFRLVYLGRLDPTKGVDLLIKALALMPDNAVSLDIYGISQGEGGKTYETQLSQLAKIDSRIHFFAPIPGDKILETLEQYDALVVPSRLMETGPLVVLEAFAAGISVIGSNLGGIKELVQDGVNGFLVKKPTPDDWAKAIKAQSERNTPKMESTKNVRTMKEVAQSMEQKYKELLNNCSVL